MTHEPATSHGDIDNGDVVANRLRDERPSIAPALRSRLERRYVALGAPSIRPPRLWSTFALLVVIGAVLLLIAGLGLAGAGPLAP